MKFIRFYFRRCKKLSRDRSDEWILSLLHLPRAQMTSVMRCQPLACGSSWLCPGSSAGGSCPACRGRTRRSPAASPPLAAGWAGRRDEKWPGYVQIWHTQKSRRWERDWKGWEQQAGWVRNFLLTPAKQTLSFVLSSSVQKLPFRGKTKPTKPQNIPTDHLARNAAGCSVSAAESPCPVNSSDTS